MENCTKFGQFILSKIIKIVATGCEILRIKFKCTKFKGGCIPSSVCRCPSGLGGADERGKEAVIQIPTSRTRHRHIFHGIYIIVSMFNLLFVYWQCYNLVTACLFNREIRSHCGIRVDLCGDRNNSTGYHCCYALKPAYSSLILTCCRRCPGLFSYAHAAIAQR